MTLMLILAAAGLAILSAAAEPAMATSRSQNIALVPSSTGKFNFGGQLPTAIAGQPGVPLGYAPVFTNVSPDTIRDALVDPIATGFDTVVLVGICDIGSNYLNNAQFKSRIENFVSNGGKLIIWDSECTSTDYSNFVYPFTTNNPGATGSNGTLTDVEENTLSSTSSSNPSYVNDAAVSTGTDAVGDANVFVTFNQNWCTDLKAKNINNVEGPTQTYVGLGSGLIIYSGLDKDALFNGIGFDPASGAGNVHLARIWLLELLQPFNPDNLPCGVKVFGLSLSPKSATNPAGTSHTVTAHLTTNASPTPGVTVTFTVTAGPNTGQTGTGVTDSNGDATFTYTSNGAAGTDTIEAKATLTGSGGQQQTVTDTASKEWKSVEQPITAHGTTVSGTEGASFSGKVATFDDPDTAATAGEYSATIDWGDGSPTTSGTISGSGGSFQVDGTHTYNEEGTYSITVVITDVDNTSNTDTAHSTAKVADAPLDSKCAASATSVPAFAGPTASFTDADPNGTSTDYTATIDWGDSSNSAGTVSPGTGSGPYTVSGAHTYSSTGTFTITTTIKDAGGSQTVATCKTLVFAFAPGGGSFVIGDKNSATGTHVTFWGAQWWKENSLTGGTAPAAFKGFAKNPAQPSCGGVWSTDPGNSAPPPNGPLPADMGVIVSSTITKSGSKISGNTPHIVVVKTDPGYQPNPGHAGTGTVEAQVC